MIRIVYQLSERGFKAYLNIFVQVLHNHAVQMINKVDNYGGWFNLSVQLYYIHI